MKKYVFVILLLCVVIISYGQDNRKKLAILVFEGVEVIDYAGPFEALSYARKDGSAFFDIFFVAKKKELIKCAGGLNIFPNYDFISAPKPDYIIVPGGDISNALNDDITITWVKKFSPGAKVTMSVCNGAYILAKSGFLDNKKATTTASGAYTKKLATTGNNINVLYDQRFVWATDSIMTTSGLSSGIDGALSLIEKEIGKGAAQDAALSMEYNWQPESGFVRSNLAEMTFLSTASMLKSKNYKGTVINSAGNEKIWEKTILAESPDGIDSLKTKILKSLREDDGWNEIKDIKNTLTCKFIDKRNIGFSGTAVIENVGNKKYLVTIKVKRARLKHRN